MLLRGVALFSDVLSHILSVAASVLGRGVGIGVYSERAREVSPPGPWEQREKWLVSCLEEGHLPPSPMSLWFIQASFQFLKYRCRLKFFFAVHCQCNQLSIQTH